MAELIDSGSRRSFSTGAVRDLAEGKGRCDLLPLAVLAGMPWASITICKIFIDIDRYVRVGDISHLYNALNNFSTVVGVDRQTLILEVAKQYEDGGKKYDDRNWEKGIQVHCYIDSGVRHLLKYLRGDTDEPHDRAFAWNILCAIWTHVNKPELIDLPFISKEADAV